VDVEKIIQFTRVGPAVVAACERKQRTLVQKTMVESVQSCEYE
jgi:hypothetical protein